MIHEKLMMIQTAISVPKNLYNKFGNYYYRNAETICEAVKPFLTKENCSLTIEDDVIAVGDRIYIKATATITDNKDKDSVSVSAIAREPIERKGMDASQITGASSSYARKYALNGLFLLDDNKDADTEENRVEAEARAQKDAPKSSPHRRDTPEEAQKNEEMKSSVDPVFLPTRDKKITKEQWAHYDAELKRTGIDESVILSTYSVTSKEELTQAQLISAFNKFKVTPNKK